MTNKKQNTDIEEVVDKVINNIGYCISTSSPANFIEVKIALKHALTTHGKKIREEERERIWKVASEHRYQYEEDGKLDRYSQGANRVVKAIWEALGGEKDENGIWHLQARNK